MKIKLELEVKSDYTPSEARNILYVAMHPLQKLSYLVASLREISSGDEIVVKNYTITK